MVDLMAVVQGGYRPDLAPSPSVGLTRQPPPVRAQAATLAEIGLRDQDGKALSYSAFLMGRPTIITFFYTRCTNPDKCSATITRLAKLQERMEEEGIRGRLRIAAITYDPEYDLPARLRAYGANRSFR